MILGMKNALFDLGVAPAKLYAAVKVVADYDAELDDYVEELETTTPVVVEETKAEPIGYTNYSATLDDGLGGDQDD